MKTEMMNNLLGATNVTPEREKYMEENLKTEETVEEKEYEMTSIGVSTTKGMATLMSTCF